IPSGDVFAGDPTSLCNRADVRGNSVRSIAQKSRADRNASPHAANSTGVAPAGSGARVFVLSSWPFLESGVETNNHFSVVLPAGQEKALIICCSVCKWLTMKLLCR